MKQSYEEKLRICRILSQRHPELVFWKHLERGLRGYGDVDAIAPPRVARSVRDELAARNDIIPAAWSLVACRHASNVIPLFMFDARSYPDLFQLDVSFRPVRLGLPWCDPACLPRFSLLDPRGVRVLRPGALALVLLMLYGVYRDGKSRLKQDDREAVATGWSGDRDTALQAAAVVLHPALRRPATGLLEGLGTSGASWDEGAARQLWWACARAAARHHLHAGVAQTAQLLQQRRQPWCELQNTVHHHDRIVPDPDFSAFIRRMRAGELFLRDATERRVIT